MRRNRSRRFFEACWGKKEIKEGIFFLRKIGGAGIFKIGLGGERGFKWERSPFFWEEKGEIAATKDLKRDGWVWL
jgi:hypothetical protein